MQSEGKSRDARKAMLEGKYPFTYFFATKLLNYFNNAPGLIIFKTKFRKHLFCSQR